MNAVLLTSAYLAPVQYYTKLYAAPRVVEERGEHYVKQTYRNRCVIAGPDGPLALSLPVEHEGPRPATRDVRLSDHGNWRHTHWAALCSAYENSPYFPYYADDFRRIYERRFTFLVDFNAALQALVCDLLDLHPDLTVRTDYVDAAAEGLEDLRERIRPKTGFADDAHFRPAPYYQVFAARTGFLPNLSMADLPPEVSCATFLSENLLVDERNRELRLRYHVVPLEGMNARELVYLTCDQAHKILLSRFSSPRAELEFLDELDRGICLNVVQLYALWRERSQEIQTAYEKLYRKNFFWRWCTLVWGRIRWYAARRKRR